MASIKEKKIITLRSLDCEEFKVEEVIAKQSKMIYIVINNDIVEDGISFPIVTGKTLSKVIECREKHTKFSNEELKDWDVGYINIDQASFYGLLLMRSISFSSLFISLI